MEVERLQRLNALAERLETLYKPLKIMQHNVAVNRDEEKEKLLRAHALGEIYNPQFSYPELPFGWGVSLEDFLTELQPEDDTWEASIFRDVKRKLAALRATETHDPDLITGNTIEIFGDVSSELVRAAREELVAAEESPEEYTIPAQEVAELMRAALSQVDLGEWTVLVSEDMNSRMSVRAIDKQVKIHEGEFFTPNQIKRLLFHEIGTHVFRSVNGRLQPLKLLSFGFDTYLLTEEGLATYHEAKYAVRNPDDRRRYALRVIAAALSLEHGFYHVFTEICQHTTTSEAFDIVVRAKRGFKDTSVPGAHVKDKVYLEGFLTVSSHLEKHPEDYALLMSGKVAIEAIPMLQELRRSGHIVEPKYLPKMLV